MDSQIARPSAELYGYLPRAGWRTHHLVMQTLAPLDGFLGSMLCDMILLQHCRWCRERRDANAASGTRRVGPEHTAEGASSVEARGSTLSLTLGT